MSLHVDSCKYALDIQSLKSYLEQDTLRTRHLSFPSSNLTSRHPRRNSKRLERTLRPVMIILSSDTINVHRHTSALRKRLQTMRDHLAAQISNLLPCKTQVDD